MGHRAYYADWLYLPHGVLNGASIKAALSFPVRSRNKIVDYIRAYKEDEDYLAVPREFYTEEKLRSVGMELEEQVPSFEHVDFEDRITLRDEVQKTAFEKMKKAGRGVLCLGCGGGKTVLALKYVAHAGVPTIIIVHTEDLLRQWKDAVRQFLGISDPGIIQGPIDTWDWKKPIVMAMLHTLAGNAAQVPSEIRKHFGVAIADETHHLSAPFFCKSIHLFYGERFGLTATPEREDGLHPLFLAHLGLVFYTYLQQPLTPEVFFVNVEPDLSWRRAESAAQDKGGEFNFSKFWKVLADDRKITLRTMEIIAQCIREGRTTLVLARTHIGLYKLADETSRLAPGQVGVITGKEKGKDRERALRTKSIIFAVAQLGKEGLDRPDLDTLILLEPIRAEGAFRQVLGRILRDVKKNKPRVYIMRPQYTPIFAMCNAMKKHLRRWKIPFSDLKEDHGRSQHHYRKL